MKRLHQLFKLLSFEKGYKKSLAAAVIFAAVAGIMYAIRLLLQTG